MYGPPRDQDILAENTGLKQELAELRQELAEAKALAFQDALTGIPNRGGLMEALGRELSRCFRAEQHAAVLMIDVDHFKVFNDQHGHQAGDEVLREVAQAIQRSCRGSDFCGRYGGEEFTVVMGGLERRYSEQAELLAERVRGAVECIDIAGLPQVTVSVGVKVAEPGAEALEMLDQADQALYCAKEAGRNCVQVSL